MSGEPRECWILWGKVKITPTEGYSHFIEHSAFEAMRKERDEWERLATKVDKERDAAIAERDELREKFNFTYCAYCSEKFDADKPDLTELVTKHISVCDKHPNYALAKERDELRARAESAKAELDRADFYKIEAFRSKLSLDAEREKSERLEAELGRLQAIIRSQPHTENYKLSEKILQIEAKLKLAVEKLDTIASSPCPLDHSAETQWIDNAKTIAHDTLKQLHTGSETKD